MAVLLAFRKAVEAICTACGRPTSVHRVGTRWIGCTRDVTVMQDQATVERRLRLALIQARVSRAKLQPFGVER